VQALPIIMSGRDCIGIAKTGSGKTLAFVLPMLRHIKDQPPLENGDGPIALIMAPTRELVAQISKVCGRGCLGCFFVYAGQRGRAYCAHHGAHARAGGTDLKGVRQDRLCFLVCLSFASFCWHDSSLLSQLHVLSTTQLCFLLLQEMKRRGVLSCCVRHIPTALSLLSHCMC
jgi:hypothetical protein